MVKKPRRNNFAEMLKTLRTAARLNQIALARLLGVTQVTVSLYESGRREPDLDDLMTIAEKLETTPNDLLGFSSRPPQLRDSATPREINNISAGDNTQVAIGNNNTQINFKSSSTPKSSSSSPQARKKGAK